MWYKSKKFWATISGCLGIIGANYFGLDPIQIENFAMIIGGYIIGQGLADIGKNMPKQ